MTHDPRDEVWNATFRAYYDSYYEELLAAELIRRWEFLDDLTKVLLALTASSSAVTGWVLWQHPGFRVVWAVIAGSAAILSILSGALRVSTRVRDWNESCKKLAAIRVDFEALRDQMRINPAFGVRRANASLERLRARYRDIVAETPEDPLLTDRLKNRVQDSLNERLRDQIDEDE